MTVILDVQGLEIAERVRRMSPAGGSARALVRDVSFTVSRGEIVCLVGESGSGKSLTALSLMGLLPSRQLHVRAGRILHHGRDLAQLDERAWQRVRGRDLAMVFQEPMTALNPVLRVGDQIEESLRRHTDLSAAARRARVQALLHRVRLPDPARLAQAYPFELSGGQRQRIMIAIALALTPDVLIADEPTTALDVTTQASILALVRELRDQLGLSVLFITHDFGVVSEIADRVLVMRQGEILESGPVGAVLASPSHPYTQGLIDALPGRASRPAAARGSAGVTPLMSVRAVSKDYGVGRARRIAALRDVTLDIAVGETVGLVGESGSGKSTLGRILVGLERPDSGSLVLDGVPLETATARAWRLHRHAVQMVFQDPYASLNPRHRVLDAIAQGPIAHGVPSRQARLLAAQWMERLGLDPSWGERYPLAFSGGQRQRIGIARALIMSPRLLVADEAVSALDVSTRAEILACLDDLKHKHGLTLLFITHDLRVAAAICDRIVVLNAGRIVESGRAANVLEAPAHPYTRQLVAAIPGTGMDRPEVARNCCPAIGKTGAHHRKSGTHS